MDRPGRVVFLAACSVCAFAQTATFKTETSLQSIAVQVSDKKGNDVKGLTASDFTLLEDGKPQRIAFFGAEQQPVSLAVLLDASSSMENGGKLARARSLLAPLLQGNSADDEIFLVPFTERLQAPFARLSADQRRHPPEIHASADAGGTALYDALASALCQMRTAQNLRQAVVVITDGADQSSRLNLAQLIQLTRSSSVQVFMIGFFDRQESEIFRQAGKTVTLVGEREIDNPIAVFHRLARESGAESFFPSSVRDLESALGRISAILGAQYTLAYYPHEASRYRKIEVKVKRGGVRILARRGVGADSAESPVHFVASGCEVSPKDHPYPWEPHTALTSEGALVYRDDFRDPRSGWPNRDEQDPAEGPRGAMRFPYQAGMRYTARGYQLLESDPRPAEALARGVVVAYGPFWDNFRASVRIESFLPARNEMLRSSVPALIFHLDANGYYAALLSGTGGKGVKSVSVSLVKRQFSKPGETVLIPWTRLPQPAADSGLRERTLGVTLRRNQIFIQVDGHDIGISAVDTTFPRGLVGLGLFGQGRALFNDLQVEGVR